MKSVRNASKNASRQKSLNSSNARFLRKKKMNQCFQGLPLRIKKSNDDGFFLPDEIKMKSFQQAFKDFIDNIYQSKQGKELKTAKMIVERCEKGQSQYGFGNELIGYTVDRKKIETGIYKANFIHIDILRKAKKIIRRNNANKFKKEKSTYPPINILRYSFQAQIKGAWYTISKFYALCLGIEKDLKKIVKKYRQYKKWRIYDNFDSRIIEYPSYFLVEKMKEAQGIIEKCKKGIKLYGYSNNLLGYNIDCNRTEFGMMRGTFVHIDYYKKLKKFVRKNKTAEECLQDLHDAMNNLLKEIAKALYIDKLLDRLSKLLSNTRRNAGERRE